MSIKFSNNPTALYMNDIFTLASQPNTTTTASFLKLNQALCQKKVSYMESIIWYKLPDHPKNNRKPLELQS